MVYEEYIKSNKAAFITEVKRISALLKIDPDWLMTIMYAESRVNEKAVNKQKGDTADDYERAKKRATGLIQFMPNTAIGLGTTTQKLYNLTNVQQLWYVYKYYEPYAGKIKSVVDMYKLTFFPIMMGKPADWVLQTSQTPAYTIAKQNGIIDENKDGKITVAEFEGYVLRYLKKKYN